MARRPAGPWRFLPMLFVMAVIFYFSHQPGDSIHLPDVIGFDKLCHAVEYAVLAASALFAFHDQSRTPVRTALAVLVFCVLYAASDELHQSFVPDRTVSLADIAADSTGAAVLLLFYLGQASELTGKRADT